MVESTKTIVDSTKMIVDVTNISSCGCNYHDCRINKHIGLNSTKMFVSPQMTNMFVKFDPTFC